MLPRLLIVTGFLALAHGSGAILAGTEDDPELTDPAGNVEYGQFYIGPQDRDHIDLRAGWLEHIDEGESIQATLKVESLDDIDSDGTNWLIDYTLGGQLIRSGGPEALLSFEAVKWPGGNDVEGRVNVVENGEARALANDFSVRTGPDGGYLVWAVGTASLLSEGAGVQGFNALAEEEQIVEFVSTGAINRNAADASASFSFAPPDVETQPSGSNTTSTSLTTSGGSTDEETPFFPVGLAATLVAALATLHRSRTLR